MANHPKKPGSLGRRVQRLRTMGNPLGTTRCVSDYSETCRGGAAPNATYAR